MNKKINKEFDMHSANRNLRAPEITFSITNPRLDDIFNMEFGPTDYIEKEGDIYYTLTPNEFDRFLDFAMSSGFDVDRYVNQIEDLSEEGSVTGGEAFLPSLHAKKKSTVKEGEYPYRIEVAVSDAHKALDIVRSDRMFSNNVRIYSSNFFLSDDPSIISELFDEFEKQGVQMISYEVPSEASDFYESILSGYKEVPGFRPGHTPDKGGFQYKDLWGMNESYTPSKTNAEELARVEALLSQAHVDKAYSVMSSYEFRIKMLRLLVGLEKKYGIALPFLKFGLMVGDYLAKYFPGFKGKFGPYAQNWKSVKDHIEQNIQQQSMNEDACWSGYQMVGMKDKGGRQVPNCVPVNEEELEEAYIPSNIEEFAKRKGIMPIVKQVSRWAEKAGKRIVGGTAIGKNYSTLILDLTYQGGEIRINTDTDEIEVKGEEVYDYNSFVTALGTLNENYARFRNETKTRSGSEQYHQAVKLVKKKVQEISKLHSYMERMQQELSETQDGLKKKKYTQMAIDKIKAEVKELNNKIKKLK